MSTSKIARAELRHLFYSPVAWFLVIIFLLQCAYYYLVPLYETAYAIDWVKKFGGGLGIVEDSPFSLTQNLFFLPGGIISQVNNNLYLFIPLLTMGVISRESNNGTIKLLYSSPVKLRHIVAGKYIAVMTFILVLIFILAFFMVLGAFQIRSVDYGLFLSALLGLTLLAGAYSAIGLFMSSLSNYQIVSGIATFTLLFVLTRVGGLWQQYDFVRDLTWFLSLAGRTDQLLAGLITTRDVIYFIVVIIMFLSFTLFKLKGERESKPWTIKALRYTAVIVVSLIIGYITLQPKLVGYLDATAEKVNTISPEMQQLLKKMEKDTLEITLYGNLWGTNLGLGLPQGRNNYLYKFWDRYIRFKPDIIFKYVYYYDNDNIYSRYPNKTPKQISGLIADAMSLDSSMFISPAEIRKQIDPYAEDLNLFMKARYKGDTINLRTYPDPNNPWPNEQEIASKFKRLIEKKGPKVYFLTGNLQRSIFKYGEREFAIHTITKNSRASLVNAAFDVDTLNLETQDIPAVATALILADPRTQMSDITLNKLERYIADGGNLMVLGEPGKQDIVNPVLRHFGVRQKQGQLVQTSFDETPDKVMVFNMKALLDILQMEKIEKEKLLKANLPDTAKFGKMIGASALDFTDSNKFVIKPIYKTFPDHPEITGTVQPASGTPAQQSEIKPVPRRTWLKMGRLVIDSVAPVFNPQEGDIKDSLFVTGVSVTRQLKNRQQRIVVIGDADQLANRDGGTTDFYNWFDYGEHPVLIPGFHFWDGELIVSAPTVKMLIIICLCVMPGLLLLSCTILLIRRKRK